LFDDLAVMCASVDAGHDIRLISCLRISTKQYSVNLYTTLNQSPVLQLRLFY